MSKVPAVVDGSFVSGIAPLSRGKVRDTYRTTSDALLMPVATDRVSIFDFVLPALVRQKGEILNALNVFWCRELATSGTFLVQDIVSYGSDIDGCLPMNLRNNPEIQKRATIVEKLSMVRVEAIVRGYLTGSGWKSYRETGKVCGHELPPGLRDGDKLPHPIFTPTTKAAVGHDEHMEVEDFRARFGTEMEELSLDLFKVASAIAGERGIIIADTKFEFGMSSGVGKGLILADERFTPDSSRFWSVEDWERSRTEGRSPVSYDKQFVREWGKSVGIDKRDPTNPADIAYVQGLTVPEEVLRETTNIYRKIFVLLTGMHLETYQWEILRVGR